MSHPAVDFVLDKIKSNWSAGSYSEIPLERVAADDSKLLDEGVRSRTQELQENNYVEAAYVDRNTAPIGTEYDLRVDGVVVRVRVAGLHKSEYGKVDPDASIPPATANDPVPFNDSNGLVAEIKDALHAERSFPDATSRVDETDLTINNTPGPLSYEYGDYYLYEFEVAIAGYEEL